MKKNFLIIYFLSIVLVLPVFQSCSKKEVKTSSDQQVVHYDFSEFDNFFKKYIRSGNVDYSRVRSDDATAKISETMKNVEPYLIEDGNQRLAFWINVYNFYTIKLIADNYPVNSILEIEEKTGMDPWDIKFIETAGGRKFSLDEIEKKIIIPDYEEPGIHYALVCAAESCPVIIAEAYLPQTLNEQLDRQARIFINDKTKNYLDKKSNELFLSNIYKWYRKDFVNKDSSVIKHISKYINKDDLKFITDNNTENISILDYSWELNDTKEK